MKTFRVPINLSTRNIGQELEEMFIGCLYVRNLSVIFPHIHIFFSQRMKSSELMTFLYQNFKFLTRFPNNFCTRKILIIPVFFVRKATIFQKQRTLMDALFLSGAPTCSLPGLLKPSIVVPLRYFKPYMHTAF